MSRSFVAKRVRRRRLTLLSAMATALLVFSVPSAANAWVYTSNYTNFNSMPTLGSDRIARGDVVTLWQNFLAAEGTAPLCKNANGGGVDGNFGSRTTSYTKSWQNRFMGSGAADGRVGPKTWAKAWGYVVNYGYQPVGLSDDSFATWYEYQGLIMEVTMRRNSATEYRMPAGKGQWYFYSEAWPADKVGVPLAYPDIRTYPC